MHTTTLPQHHTSLGHWLATRQAQQPATPAGPLQKAWQVISAWGARIRSFFVMPPRLASVAAALLSVAALAGSALALLRRRAR